MVVNIGFIDRNRNVRPIARANVCDRQVPAQNPRLGIYKKASIQPPRETGTRAPILKNDERLSKMQQEAAALKTDLDSAVLALAAANAENDRLSAELAMSETEMRRLNAEVCQLRQALEKARHKKGRGKKGERHESADGIAEADSAS